MAACSQNVIASLARTSLLQLTDPAAEQKAVTTKGSPGGRMVRNMKDLPATSQSKVYF